MFTKVPTNIYHELGQAKLRLAVYEYMHKVYNGVALVNPAELETATCASCTEQCFSQFITTYSDEMDDFRQLMFKVDYSNDRLCYFLPELNRQRETDCREDYFFEEGGGTLPGILLRINALEKAIDLVKKRIVELKALS